MAHRTRFLFLEWISGWQTLNLVLENVPSSVSSVADSRGHWSSGLHHSLCFAGFTVGEVSVSDKAACTSLIYTAASSS